MTSYKLTEICKIKDIELISLDNRLAYKITVTKGGPHIDFFKIELTELIEKLIIMSSIDNQRLSNVRKLIFENFVNRFKYEIDILNCNNTNIFFNYFHVLGKVLQDLKNFIYHRETYIEMVIKDIIVDCINELRIEVK